jgi:hypothetical protein
VSLTGVEILFAKLLIIELTNDIPAIGNDPLIKEVNVWMDSSINLDAKYVFSYVTYKLIGIFSRSDIQISGSVPAIFASNTFTKSVVNLSGIVICA